MNDERVHWDTAARRGARRAVWDDDGYDEATQLHVQRVIDGIGPVPNGARVLDLGCGIGRLGVRMAKRKPFVTIVGVDVSPEMLKKMPKVPNLVSLACDGRQLGDVGALWAAYSVLTFQHIPNDAVSGYIGQVARRLRQRGPFVFQYVEGETDAFLAHDLTEPTVREFCEAAGLEVRSVVVDDSYSPNWRWVTAVKT